MVESVFYTQAILTIRIENLQRLDRVDDREDVVNMLLEKENRRLAQ
jgi:hypothetical protein